MADGRLCPAGHATVESRFRFDHEEGDSERDRRGLERLEMMGVELGAEVVLWRCDVCGWALAEFDYGDARE